MSPFHVTSSLLLIILIQNDHNCPSYSQKRGDVLQIAARITCLITPIMYFQDQSQLPHRDNELEHLNGVGIIGSMWIYENDARAIPKIVKRLECWYEIYEAIDYVEIINKTRMNTTRTLLRLNSS